MKKYYPKKLIGKEGRGVFSDVRVLLTIGGATILALLLPIFIYAPLMQVNSKQHAAGNSYSATVSMTNPLNGAVLQRGSKVTISAIASDNVAVTKVLFYVNNLLLNTDTTAPYNYTWNVPSKPHVTYTLQAVAYDVVGNTATSSIIVTSN